MDPVERRLRRIIELSWEVPYPESRMLVRVLMTAEVPAARVLRQHLDDFDIHFLTMHGIVEKEASSRQMQIVLSDTITPKFIVDLIEELVDLGMFTRDNARVVEKAVLRCVSSTGTWKVSG